MEKLSANAQLRRNADNAVSDQVADDRSLAQVSQAAVDRYKAMLSDRGQPEPVCHVHQIMTRPVETLAAHWTLHRAREQFQSHPYEVFPIVDACSRLCGALSRLHYYELLAAEDFTRHRFGCTLDHLLLTSDHRTYAVDPVTDVRRLATLLLEEELYSMPVVQDSGVVIGIVSRSDVLRCVTANPPLSLWC
ncbi:CBS domain-containing protein [Pseudomaricurvus alkylphenolicus]|uniref:CBS domain-containing protein n=1 Tax=Pseudomaricurvus alkylphenolicus TaxID=1306991 RepID=UPI00141EFF6F|nr:CBS domain-containing protein [Pseudomaricurvus alkylphenolicus]